MDIRCPQCQTLYEIDADRIDSNDATLKCRECEHLFRLGAGRVPTREDAQRWMVRDSPQGDILYFDGFDALRDMILDGEVDRAWEISRTGDVWRKLGDVGEFDPVFQRVDRESPGGGRSGTASDEGGARVVQADDSGPRPRQNTQNEGETSHRTPGQGPAVAGQQSPPSEGRASDESTSPQASNDDGSGEVQLESGRFGGDDATEGAGEGEEWSFGGDAADEDTGFGESADEPIAEFDDELEFGRSRRWPYLVVGLLVVGVVGYVWYVKPAWVMQYVEPADETPVKKTTTEKKSPATPAVSAVERASMAVADGVKDGSSVADDTAGERVDAAIAEIRALRDDAVAAAKSVVKRRMERRQRQAESAAGVAEKLRRAHDALQRGNASEAKRLYRQVLDEEPRRAEALSGLGWSLVEAGQSGDAVSYFKQAREADPSYGDAYVGLARAQRDLGRYEAALETYQSYLASFPNGPKASIAEYQSEQLRKQLGIQ